MGITRAGVFRCRCIQPARLFLRLNSSVSGASKRIKVDGVEYNTDPTFTNVTKSIISHTNKGLHLNDQHPVGILRDLIERKLNSVDNVFMPYNNFKPVVTTWENFDSLGFPANHPGRSKSDTYYINQDHLLRTHTSAHEVQCFQDLQTSKHKGFLISADVYRRDEIDRTHYPVFHQMEGARLWEHGDLDSLKRDLEVMEKALKENQTHTKLLCVSDAPAIDPEENPKQSYMTAPEVELTVAHLKRSLELTVSEVFNRKIESLREMKVANVPTELKYRWVKAYFPWTAPSYEIEVWWQGEWLEICGCGVIKQDVLNKAGFKLDSTMGWAFGLGLDRIAMILFEIPDIRLLWTADERFHRQFKRQTITAFKPYSKHPGSIRDVAFWLPEGTIGQEEEIHENDIMEIVRDTAGSLVESVKLIDSFVDPKTNKKSLCYRINYQSMERNITNLEVNDLQKEVVGRLIDKYHVTIR
ncbi:phenylalanine--tRNA ligase KNAG_0H00830 [Huiozyma naganishii CBS 8797]|uniref:Phenylalanine--tRNA ligase, mitochondrial n=1 Tax=Huiozyma naganishii (strain ATCC MYA-139 / BCRC 22969 / CBS 8797 / KCTC 17520 / NBRC 10181 / NCYC 3082 / Yp74L-3) TaxID=1071383 RepID=J7RPA5_HUIN7|nr:hypothetical protein KNAG_0H00830 [Kazachstania naganishii CBS 8797]CCK71498.1 hypothetical protein KNAG_0H00830 [Kazachstania naganishii CBS 8797]